MNGRLVVVPLVLLALSSCGGGTQSNADFGACKSNPNADQQIAACTQVIASGQLSWSDRANAFHNRGTAWAGKRDYGRAIADYDEAIHLNPLYVVAYYNRFMAQHSRSESAAPKTTTARKDT